MTDDTHSTDPVFAMPSAPVDPVVVAGPRRRSVASTFVNVLLGVALAVAVGGVAFAAGRATAPASAATGQFGANGQTFGRGGPSASGAPGRGGFGGFGGGGAGAGAVSIQGTVTATTSDSVTIQLPSGQSVTIPTDAQTTYHSQASATATDVSTGSKVIVQLSGGRFLGQGNGGQGQGGPTASGAPAASGAPGRGTGAASSITVVPAGS